MNEVYLGLQPAELWRHFDALNRIPRPSGHEAQAREYVRQVATEAGLAFRADSFGNCVVTVPSRGAKPDAPAVVVQAHLDMVRATAAGIAHNFETDPIIPQRIGDRIFATGTTLGADNGIGAAAALALITDPNIQHGPLELLFTVEEETGLVGANALDISLLTSKMLINIDSDNLTVGCAGGETLQIMLPLVPAGVTPGFVTSHLEMTGLQGGHSGVQIHERRANAIKLLAGILREARNKSIDFRLMEFIGGSAHNAIPKDAAAVISIAPDSVAAMESLVEGSRARLLGEWADDEPGLTLTLTAHASGTPISCMANQDVLLDLIHSLPTGVLSMSKEFEGKVQTSRNLAAVGPRDGATEIIVSIRSFVGADIDNVRTEIEALGAAAGASVHSMSKYPSWPPAPDSKLLAVTWRAYERVHGVPPVVDVVHAGLECGVIAAKMPGMEAVSFGARIDNAHSPTESVDIASVDEIWRLLLEILKSVSE